MTASAVPGKLHWSRPAGVEEWSVDLEFVVIPWTCPTCERVIAETIVQRRKPKLRTVPTWYSPVRMPEADEDGIPFYGPSRRAMRGMSERRSLERLRNSAFRRADAEDGNTGPRKTIHEQDHAPIEAETFALVCDDCAVRLVVRVADALPQP